MIRSLDIKNSFARSWKSVILLTVFVGFICALFPSSAAAQRRFNRTYPAGQNVRLQLLNRTGTVTVEGWNRNEVSISASLEAPAANIEPQSLSGTIYVNLVKD